MTSLALAHVLFIAGVVFAVLTGLYSAGVFRLRKRARPTPDERGEG